SIIGSDAADPDVSNNSATVPVTVDGTADVSLTFVNPPGGTLLPGTQVIVFLQAHNNGPSATQDVRVHFALPPGFVVNGAPSFHGSYDAATGTWDVGPMDLNTDRNWLAFVFVQPTGSTSLTASITNSSRPDSNLANNTATGLSINRRPVSNAGPDQSVATNTTVTLDGRQSFDPDGDPFTY